MARITTLITPGIDAVIHARVEAMSRAEWARKAGPEKLPFVTLSREYGCGAYNVARALEKTLNARPEEKFPWMAFDKEILARIAQESGHYPGMVRLVAEGKLSMIERVVIDMLSGLPNDYEVYKKIVRTMCVLAEKGHAILVGRGGAWVTRTIERGLHVRLVAPLDYRVDRIAKERGQDRSAAEKEVRKMEGERETFLQKYTMHSPADTHLYHLILNTALCPDDEIVHTIVEFLRHRRWL